MMSGFSQKQNISEEKNRIPGRPGDLFFASPGQQEIALFFSVA